MRYLLPLIILAAAAAPPRPPQPPDIAAAQRGLSRALSELEEIVGRDLLTAQPPLLPDVSGIDWTPEEGSAAGRLLAQAPTDWSEADRNLLAAALASNREALGELDREPHEPFAMEALLGYVRVGRLLSLQTRSSLSAGDEAAFLQGIDRSDRLAQSLRRQPQLSASLIGQHLEMLLLQDVQLAAESPATGAATLAALAWTLAAWQELPDGAATLAREALFSLQAATGWRDTHARDLASADSEAAETALLAATARDWALLARRCREVGARRAARELADSFEEDAGPYRTISGMLLPNLMDGVAKLEELATLTEVARAALALRLAALESGGYPAALDALPATAAAGRGELSELSYRRERGGARLGLGSEPPPVLARGLTAETSKRLQTWNLPAITPAPGR